MSNGFRFVSGAFCGACCAGVAAGLGEAVPFFEGDGVRVCTTVAGRGGSGSVAPASLACESAELSSPVAGSVVSAVSVASAGAWADAAATGVVVGSGVAVAVAVGVG